MTEPIKVDKNYFDVGTPDKPVLSNSGGSALNPEEGGSPRQFIEFLEGGNEKKQSRALDTGSLFHEWIRNPEDFVVDEGTKPKPAEASLVEAVFEAGSQAVANGIAYKDLTNDLVLKVRGDIGYNSNYKDETVVKKFEECEAYYEFLATTAKSGQVMLDAVEKVKLDEMEINLKSHELANRLLFRTEDGVDHFEEEDIYWYESVVIPELSDDKLVEKRTMRIPCKGKMDDFSLNHDLKLVTLNDVKTTRFHPASYQESFERYFVYRQLAHYFNGIREFCKGRDIDIEGWRWHFNIIVAQTTDLYEVMVRSVPPIWITRGLVQITSLYERFAFHRDTNQWELSLEEARSNGYTPFSEDSVNVHHAYDSSSYDSEKKALKS